MIRTLMAAALLAAPVLAAPLAATAEGDADSDHVSEIGDVRIIHAWARATDHDHTTVYFEIENNGDVDVTLAAATSDIAKHAHIMGASIKADGDPVELGMYKVTAGTHFELSPESVFVEIDGLAGHLHEGDEFEMTVMLKPLGEVVLDVEVEAEDAHTHSHAGHNH